MASSKTNHNDSSNHSASHNGHASPTTDKNYLTNHNNNGKVICDEMVYYCFDVLNNYFHRNQETRAPRFTNNEFPLFVTWYIGKEKRLRGCIGTFSPLNLHDGLKEYAITSAFRDSRFNPISKDEMSKLNCSVSLLTNFEPAKSWNDWHIGTHGIRIEFLNEKGQKKSSTYLPEIAPEQNWDHTETIDSLLRKGGYKATITNDLRNQLSVVRYQSEKITRSFNDWLKQNSTSV
jgi:AMME syndrome candidate gene 1 protein